MITKNKKCKLAFKIFSLLCSVAIVVCLICDIAINKGFTWSGYPLISLAYAWIVVSVFLLAEKYKITCSLVALTIILAPFLFFMELLTPVKGWFFALGAPIAVIGILSIWITYVFIRFVKTNIWYRAAALVFLYGVIAAPIANYFANTFVGSNFLSLSNIINIISCIVITVLLAIIGYYKIPINGQNAKDEDKS